MKSNASLPLRLKRKHTLLSALKTIAYFVGFPLLILAVGIGSIKFMNFTLFSSTWNISIILALVIWAVCGVVQIVMSGAVRGRNSQYVKTAVVAALAIVCLLGCAIGIDYYGAKTMDDINAKYAAETDQNGVVTAKKVEIPTYRFQNGASETITWTMSSTDVSFETIDYLKGHYVSVTSGFTGEVDKFKSNVENFCRIYNVQQQGSLKKSTTDADGDAAVYNSDYTTSKVDAATGLPVNKNGLVSESYVYGMDFAINVLINYNEAVNALNRVNPDMTQFVDKEDGESDEEYAARLAAMTPVEKMEAVYAHELKLVDQSPEYLEYKNKEGGEYKAAYGENGSALGYMLTLDRVEEMLPVLVKYLLFVLTYNELTGGTVFSLVDSMLNLARYDANGDPHPDSLLAALTAEGDMFENAMDWADAKLPTILNLVGMDWSEIRAGLTKEKVVDLINDYFYYYSPSVRPDFDFFGTAKQGERTIGEITVGTGDDARTFTVAEMRAFAFARYYAKLNGAVIGSVLVPNNDTGIGSLTNANGHIGMITMNDSGYEASFAYSLTRLYQLKADTEYVPTLFPVLVARRYMYIFAGLVALSIVLFYQFGRREEEVMAELLTYCQEGGADHE